jgi:azurin
MRLKYPTHKVSYFLAALVATAGLFSAVGQDPQTPVSKGAEQHFDITANDQMKFNVTTLNVKADQKVSITLKDIGTLPKIGMGHNWTLLAINTDVKKFIDAGLQHASDNYVAPEFKTKVLAQTKLIGPGESDTITFTAPHWTGKYTFVCTFPGHFASGMKGEMFVDPSPKAD